jgi:hypothetical protein
MPTTLSTFNPTKLEPIEFPEDARIEAVVMGASLTVARGTVLGKVTATNKHAAYNDALTNGVEVATCIAVYDFVTDASGNVYLGTSAVASEMNLPHATAPVYVAGVFNSSELTGWNAAAAVDFHARLLPSGYYRIP